MPVNVLSHMSLRGQLVDNNLERKSRHNLYCCFTLFFLTPPSPHDMCFRKVYQSTIELLPNLGIHHCRLIKNILGFADVEVFSFFIVVKEKMILFLPWEDEMSLSSM